MSYFSRLTDIVTCNLSELLAEADDPAAALEAVIAEMQMGVEAARRSVTSATATEERIRMEIEELSNQKKYWTDLARQELGHGREDKARSSLMRKAEISDLIAGIEQQHESALSTLKQLTTTLHALEARLADAIRRRASIAQSPAAPESALTATTPELSPSHQEEREQQIDEELAALKRELNRRGRAK